MNLKNIQLGGLLLSALTAAAVHADTQSMSNLGGPFSSTREVNASIYGGGSFDSFQALPAHRFLESVTVSLGTPIVDDGGLSFSIYTGANLFAPLTLVTTLTGESSPDIAGLYTYTAPPGVSLVGNTLYFLLASVSPGSSSRYLWNLTSFPGQTTTVDTWDTNDDWLKRNANLQPAGFTGPEVPMFSVALSDISNVPETSTWVAGLGLLGVVGATWWRARRQVTATPSPTTA